MTRFGAPAPMRASRDGDVVTLATGDSRQITKFYDGGYVDCPWCGGSWPPGETSCPNPACLAYGRATEDEVRDTLARWAADAAERERRTREAALAAQLAQEKHEADAQLWNGLAAEAKQRGACLDCLRRSRWRDAPRFVRHRRADFHEGDHR